jgi:hypothetical protein
VVFELLPPEFTLTELQRTVEAISGRHLHKQNFRRLVEAGALVEPTGASVAQVLRRSCRVHPLVPVRLNRQALAAAKARGVTLGSPKLSKARESAVASIRAGADQHAANILPIIREAQKAGATSLRAVADALNARGISTPRGGTWYAMSVKNVLDRPIARKSQLGER